MSQGDQDDITEQAGGSETSGKSTGTVPSASESADTALRPSDPLSEQEPPIATLPEREDANALTVVGLGGSAGSIPALEAFFQSVPADSGSAYVVITHLAPEHESHLAEVLGRSARIPVRQVTFTVPLEPNQVYVIPPGKHLELHDGRLQLSDLGPASGRRVQIDTFFRTLAVVHGPQASAIVFSGTGADGTLGIRHIKEYGGLTIAQSPSEAEYDAMPRSAIATGMVDYVLPSAAMPAQIASYWQTSRRMRLPAEAAPSPEQKEEGPELEYALADVLMLVRAQTGHDFSQYKRATVLRRIGRRMQVNNLDTLPAYRDFLRSHPAEVGELIGDILISVTQFFRDPDVWEALDRDVIPRLFHGRAANEEVRAWVCGCATGEEAYTLAILLLERAERFGQQPRIQIFASDMDADAIARARVGIYPETVAGDVSEERLRRWFYRQNNSYQIRKEVREIVLFANHDVLRDTPFSRLDLITCRNLLIYLNREAQERVFNTFHFALRPDGRLLLGTSESADGADDLFSATDKQHRLYVRRAVVRSVVPPLPTVATLSGTAMTVGGAGSVPHSADVSRLHRAPLAGPSVPVESLQGTPTAVIPRAAYSGNGGRELFRNLVERFGPPTVLVNEDHDVIHLSGGSSRFLRIAEGEPTYNLLQLVEPELRMELRAALYACATEQKEQTRLVRTGGEKPEERPASLLRLTVRPATETPTEGARLYFLIQFEELRPEETVSSPIGADAASEARAMMDIAAAEVARRLEEENAALQRHLRATIEQYEALTEELKASNEELQATNEEMRSVAEELETGKEELQSVNEELSTVNHELKARVEEVTTVNSDLQNFLASTDIGTIFLDRGLRIKRYTPAAESLFNLIPTDIGRPLSHLTSRLSYATLTEDAEAVLSRLVPVEREVSTSDGQRHFLARLLPYRSQDDRIQGVVVTFVDITERRRADEAVRASEARLQAVANLVPDLLWSTDARGVTDWYNQQWLEYTGQTFEEANDYGWVNAIHPEDQDGSVRSLQEAIESGTPFRQEHRIRRYDGEYRWFLVQARPLKNEEEIIVRWFGAATDIHDIRQTSIVVRDSEERLRIAVEAADMGTWDWNVLTGEVLWNERHFLLLGLPPRPGPMTVEDFFLYVYEDDRDWLRERLFQALDENRTFEAEFRARRASGEICWMQGYGQAVEYADGKPIRMCGVMNDITARKQSEQALQEALEAVAQANEQLEMRVTERTRELSERTEQLAEMSEMRQELLRQVVTAQEEERARIARDLHDDTGQAVSALLLGIGGLRNSATLAESDEIQSTLARLMDLADEVAQKSHRLSFTLRPTTLDDIGLMGALENYVQAWSTWSNLPVEVEGVGLTAQEGGPVRLPTEIETTIYRVAQEALTNILKHAVGKGANRVAILVQRRPGEVQVTIEDDGPGFDIDAVRDRPVGERRLGIFGMQERARLAGGTLTLESEPDRGTTVYLRIPLPVSATES